MSDVGLALGSFEEKSLFEGEKVKKAKVIKTKPRDGRRLPSNEPRCYEVSELRDRHYRIIEMSFLGYAEKYIAHFLNISEGNVVDVLNSQLSKDRMAILRDQRDASTVDVAKQIKELAPEAIRLMRTSLVRENQKLADDPDKCLSGMGFKVAQDTLDRSGHQPPRQGQQLFLHLTGDDLRGLKADADKHPPVDLNEIEVAQEEVVE